MTTSSENDARCSNCGSTRDACNARADSWPPYCCPSCQRTAVWGTHRATATAVPVQVPSGGW